MGKGNATETQLTLKINGEQANNTIKQTENSVRTLNRELKELPIGSQAFIEKSKELAVAQNKLEDIRNSAKDVREQMRGMGDDSKKARADLLSMSPVGNMLSNLSQGWQAMRTAIATNVAEMGFLKLAIASTGIGALIIALTALYQYFTKSDEGAKKLDAAMRAIGFITQSIIKLFIDLGEKLVWAFENPKKALAELGDLLLSQVINRFKAFGVIMQGIIDMDPKKIADGFIQAGTGIENATDKAKKFAEEAGKAIGKAIDDGARLAELYDAIDEKESKLLVTNAKLEQQVSQLLMQSRDRTKTEEERLALLDRASALEKLRLQESINLQKMRLEAAQLEFEQAKKNDQGKDEAFRKLSEQEAAMSTLRKESIDLQEKITVRRNQLLEVGAAEEKKRTDEFAKNQLAAQDLYRELTLKGIKDEFDRKAAMVDDEFVTRLAKLTEQGVLTTELQTAIEADRDAQLDALEKERATKKAEENLQISADNQAIAEAQLEADLANQILTEQQYQNQLYELKKKGFQERLTLLVQNGQAESTEAKKLTADILKLEKDKSDQTITQAKKTETFDKQQMLNRLDASKNFFGGLADLLGQDEEARKKNAAGIKAFSTANVILSGIQEVAQIWAKSEEMFGPVFGPIFAAVQTGLAVVRTGVAVNKINSTQYRDGGLIGTRGGQMNFGQPHNRGGIQLFDGQNGTHYGEVERGEVLAVFTQKAYENNRPIIDSLLDAGTYSGRPVRNGTRFEDGGMINTGSGSSGSQSPEQARAEQVSILNLQLLQSINDKLDRPVRAEVVYEQQSKLNADAQSIERRANAA